MADADWLRREANYLGFHEMPADLVPVAMTLRRMGSFDAMCELRRYLRLPVIW